MLIRKTESVNFIKVRELTTYYNREGTFKMIKLQKVLRTTYWFLFIPIFTYNKRID
jgi:hypothetical protein